MTFKNTVETLAQNAVYTAVSVVRHPISSAARAAGFVKGSAGAGAELVRSLLHGGRGTATDAIVPAQRRPEQATEKQKLGKQSSGVTEAQVVPKPVPDFDDLPEPIVIHADDDRGEAFHHEPKAASRDSAHGDTGGDLEDASGYAEEISADEDELVWTSESAPRVDEPLLQTGAASALRSESEMLSKAADPRVE